MKNDDKVIAKLPSEEKQELVELGEKLDMTLGQITREALQRMKPVLRQRLAEKEQATALPA
jgi:hypothetical protein